MDALKQARETIDTIDRQMAELFCRRMEAVRAIAAYKGRNGLPVTDRAREIAVLERAVEHLSQPELAAYYTAFMENLMALSRQYQHRLLHCIAQEGGGAE